MELERWRVLVLEAASRIRYDSQNVLRQQLGVEAEPLPLSERQRVQAGMHYGETSVEPDGHEVLAATSAEAGTLRLTGCFASVRPHYVRRNRDELMACLAWAQALCHDYRRLVIQNHFHKCTKSCFKKLLGPYVLTIFVILCLF